jgi:cobaltochelatase CobS
MEPPALETDMETETEASPARTPNPDKVFELLAQAVQGHLDERGVDEAKVRGIVQEELAGKLLPREIAVTLPDGAKHVIDMPHRQFTEVLNLVEEGHVNILLVGPAGSGKTTLGRNLAEALGLEFGFISLSAGVTETHLMGRMLPQSDGSWKMVYARFVEIYQNGGVFLLDEMDAADANVMVAINAALANGVLVTPDGQIHKRHARCIIIAAANTWGRGADLMYVGRNQLDAATLDRFVLSTLLIDYDADLESALVNAAGLKGKAGAELLGWVKGLREAITRNRLRRVASTRLVVNAIKALQRGRELKDVQARYFRDWSADEQAKVK